MYRLQRLLLVVDREEGQTAAAREGQKKHFLHSAPLHRAEVAAGQEGLDDALHLCCGEVRITGET